ncbi:MAG: hypothetical protein CMC15_16575 [Flavobacteriaceae bacterium]|nr:hypothetical protein [Flavobacteriaceae bacterium]
MYAPEGLSDEMSALVAANLRGRLAREYQNSRVNQSSNIAEQSKGESNHSILGQHKARIDPTSFHHWGKRLGYDCWNDRQFIKEYLRDNPESRVNAKSSKVQVGYGGNKPLGYYDTPVGRVTFRKVYGRNPRVEVDANA